MKITIFRYTRDDQKIDTARATLSERAWDFVNECNVSRKMRVINWESWESRRDVRVKRVKRAPAARCVEQVTRSAGDGWEREKGKRGKRREERGKEKKKKGKEERGGDACAAAVTAAATVAFVPSANGTRCQSSLSRAPRRWPQFTKRRPRDSRRASRSSSWLRGCREGISRLPRGENPSRPPVRDSLSIRLEPIYRADFSLVFSFLCPLPGRASRRFSMRYRSQRQCSMVRSTTFDRQHRNNKEKEYASSAISFRVINSLWKNARFSMKLQFHERFAWLRA